MSLKLNRDTFGNPEDAGRALPPEEAEALMTGWVKNPRLQWHMRQVAHLMRQWAAEREGLDAAAQERWYQAGLLHDADWDQWPEEHCRRIVEHLESQRIDPEIIHAIASHGPAHFGVDPASRMGHMLYAFDELSGFVHAYALMRPGGYDGMEPKGVRKRMKDKTFAAGVSRAEIEDAVQRAGLSMDELLSFIIVHQGSLQQSAPAV